MIRLATDGDFAQISAMLRDIHRAHARAEPSYYKDLDEVMTEKDFRAEVAAGHVMVLEEDGVVKGYAIFADMLIQNHPIIKDQKILMIDDICVLASERGRGVGRRLFGHIEKHARAHDYTSIDLNVWTFNLDAHKFYRSMGMRDTRVRMTKELSRDE